MITLFLYPLLIRLGVFYTTLLQDCVVETYKQLVKNPDPVLIFYPVANINRPIPMHRRLEYEPGWCRDETLALGTRPYRLSCRL